MDDLVCPACRQKHLRVHTILVPNESFGTQDVHYEWECGWCGYGEGDYKTVAEAKKDYDIKYGGINR